MDIIECGNFKKKTPQKRGPKTDFKKQGKRNRAKGLAFENKFRKKMEEDGWIVDKWSNNIDLQTNEIIKAGNKYIRGRGVMPGAGFPDFVMFKPHEASMDEVRLYPLQFVECKTNNILSKEEKLKLQAMKEMGFITKIAFLAGRDVKIREFLGYVDKNKT